MANYSPWRAISQALVTDSDKWKEVGDSAARLWLHLILRCDGYGSCEGDPYIIWTRCMKAFGWSKQKTIKAIQELVDADLLHVWDADGFEYAHVVDFDDHQHGEFLRKRGRRSLPQPPCECGGECVSRTIRRTKRRTPKTQIQKQNKLMSNDILSATDAADDFGNDCKTVFAHWVEIDVATGGGKASGRILNRKRRDLIVARRREGYTVEQMCQAISAFCNDPWHQGKHPTNKKRYTGLYTLIKNGDKIEAGVQLFERTMVERANRGDYVRPAAHV